MKNRLMGAVAVTLGAASAQAGGIERASNSYPFLFEEGNAIQLSFSSVTPKVSGDYPDGPAPFSGGGTGNMAGDHISVGASYKQDMTDRLSFGLFLNQPYGADALYEKGLYTGLRAEWRSEQVAWTLRYKATDRISVYGGLRYVESRADITIPDILVRGATGANARDLGGQAQSLGAQAAAAQQAGDLASAQALGAQAAALGARAQTLGAAAQDFGTSMQYDAQGATDGRMGYILGAAYEIPDIALRVALTWESEITHEFDTDEVIPGLGGAVDGSTEVTMPQSVALDFQTGVAPGTLVFGKIKWTEWSKWEVRTPQYEAATGTEVTGFEHDVITWQLGVGRQFTDALSGFARVSYEKANGGESSRLSPTDGRISLGLGGTYKHENVTLRGGLEYVRLGDAKDSSDTKFTGNSAIGAGLSVTFGF